MNPIRVLKSGNISEFKNIVTEKLNKQMSVVVKNETENVRKNLFNFKNESTEEEKEVWLYYYNDSDKEKIIKTFKELNKKYSNIDYRNYENARPSFIKIYTNGNKQTEDIRKEFDKQKLGNHK